MAARRSYQTYLVEPDAQVAAEIYNEEVRPRGNRAIVELAGAGAFAVTSGVLWVALDAEPGRHALLIGGRW